MTRLFLLFLLVAFSCFAELKEVDKAQISENAFNLLENAGFEAGISKWTKTGSSTWSLDTSTPIYGKASLNWDASATTEYLNSAQYTITSGMKGKTCQGILQYSWDSGTLTHIALQLVDGSSNILATRDLTVTTSPNIAKIDVTIPCPASGTIRLRLASTANAASIKIDNAYLGEMTNLYQISQSGYVGSITFGSDCSFSVTNAAYTNLSTDASCTATVEGSVTAVAGVIAGFSITNAKPGSYYAVLSGALYDSGADANECYFRFYDGTNAWGEGGQWANGVASVGSSMSGSQTYTTAATRSVTIQAKAAGGACQLYNGNVSGKIMVYYFPTSSELAMRADSVATSWSGYHASDCSWARTNTSYGDPTADATCTFTERTNVNFGSVSSYLSGSDKLPGIVFTPKKAGMFYVCANFNYYNNSSTGINFAELTDLVPTVITETSMGTNATSQAIPNVLCGAYNATSIAPITLKIMTKTNSSNTITINSNSTAIEWSIFPLTQSFPMMNFQGLVTSNTAGQERVERASFTTITTTSITKQSGSWLSVNTDHGTGDTTFSIASGTFSDTPTCICTAWWTTGYAVCTIQGPVTSTSIGHVLLNQSGGAVDTKGEIICMGPR